MVENGLLEARKVDRKSYLKAVAAGLVGATALLGLKDVPNANAANTYLTLGDTEVNNTNSNYTGMQSSTTDSKGTLYVVNTGSTNAIHGASTNGNGVYGYCNKVSGFGVYGANNSGKAVYGLSQVSTGVYGESVGGNGVEGRATATSGATTGVRGQSDSSSGIGVIGLAGNVGAKPIVAKGASGQTANLQEWQNNLGTALSVVDAAGKLGVGIAAPARQVHLQGNNAVFRMDRDANSSAFILVRTAAGDFNTIWKTFYVGVDASGVNNGEFFIGDVGTNVSGPSAKRLWIDNSGGVHIPNLITGDIALANDFLVTEDEKHGIAFKNDAGEKIAALDRQGNIHIKGRIIQDL